MSAVRQADTTPEMIVRRLCHAMGYRYRLHTRTLSGSPDLVFSKQRKVIFVHGCFWHRHSGCNKTTTPKTRKDFWCQKFESNVARDARNVRDLEKQGWSILIVWEYETQDAGRLGSVLRHFLEQI